MVSATVSATTSAMMSAMLSVMVSAMVSDCGGLPLSASVHYSYNRYTPTNYPTNFDAQVPGYNYYNNNIIITKKMRE